MDLDKARAVFFELLANVPAEHWDARLAELAGHDEALRRRVALLLAAHRDAGSFLEAAAPGLAATRNEPAREGPGTLIGAYKLLEQIGEGGFGVVFMAEQTEPVRRKVALKVLKPGMDTKQVVARFEAERQALAIMDHPNIARIFDGGATPLGRPYFVMELVKGVPLTDYCDRNHLTPRQRLELFVPVCQAVQHAHHKGIIHRDLKPSNVLVAVHDTTPVVKVIDFGVAKALGQELTDRTLFTGFAQMIGTPLYMSPEQAGQSSLDVDTRSDIYSLGVLLYELLTGTTPFDKERFRKAACDEIRRIIREEDPPRPSTRLAKDEGGRMMDDRKTPPSRLWSRLRQPFSSLILQPSSFPELDWIVMKALEKDRNRRYDTANGLALDVQRYLNDEQVLACPPSAGYRLRKFARRHRTALTLAALATMLLLLTVAVLAAANHAISGALKAETKALADKTQAFEELGVAKRETESANTVLQSTLAELSREQKQTRQALDKQQLALYSYRIALAHREWSANNVARAEHLLDECPEPMRHWEWHYLKRLCHSELLTLRGHPSTVACVAYSPDGALLASASVSMIFLWDAATGKKLKALRARDQVYSLAYSPDGQRLVSADRTGCLKIWDPVAGSELHSIAGHPEHAFSVAFHPDGTRFASTGRGGAVKVWDVRTGRELLALALGIPHGYSVDFSPDGRLLAAAAGNRIKLWDATTGEEHLAWTVRGQVDRVTFSPDSTRLAGSHNKSAKVWDLTSQKEVLSLPDHAGNVRSVAFSPDGRQFATADKDARVVRLWNAATGQEVGILRGHTGHIQHLAYRRDGRCLASCGADNVVKVWDLQPTPVQAFRLGSGTGTAGVVFSANGHRAGSSHVGRCAMVWDAVTGQKLLQQEPANSPLALSPDGKCLAHASVDGQIHLVDVDTGKLRQIVGQHTELRALAFSPAGSLVASGGSAGTVKIWDLATGQERLALKGSGEVAGLAFSPKGDRLASAGYDGSLWMWRVAAGRKRFQLRGHNGIVRGAAFSPDGGRFASGGMDGTVKIWDANTGRELHTLAGMGAGVMSVAFSGDGLRLAAALSDGSVIVWDTLHAREALTLRVGGRACLGVAFSHEGRLLAGGLDGVIKAWDGAPWAGEQRPTGD